MNYYLTEDGIAYNISPRRAKNSDAGIDLQAAIGETIEIQPGETLVIPSGVGFDIDKGYFGKIFDRSSMAAKGLAVTGGVVDQGYTGEVKIVITNIGREPRKIYPGDRIAQIVFMPYYRYDLTMISRYDVPSTERGSNGFGSTGN